MEITPRELITRLQNNEIPSNLIMMFGEEDFYKSKVNKLLPEILFKNMNEEEQEISRLSENVSFSEFKTEINSIPFFSENKLIVINDEKFLERLLEKEKEEFAEIIIDIPSECYVFFSIKKIDKRSKIYKKIKENGIICESQTIKSYQLGNWLNEQAKAEGGKFTNEAIAIIMEYLAPVENVPLKLLEQEIKKIAIYAKDKAMWDQEDVKTMLSELPEASGFAINNAIAEKNLKTTLELLAIEKKKGTYLLPLCGLISYQLHRMTRFLELKQNNTDKQTICNEIRLPNFFYQKFAEQCKNFKKDNLETAIIEINELNSGLRQGGRSYPRLEEILIKLISK